MNREVKVIIPNMREFRVFYSDNEGTVMLFKRDWIEEKQKEQWKPKGLEEEIDRFEDWMETYNQSDYPTSFTTRDIARHFAQWGAEHLATSGKTSGGSSEIPNCLNELADYARRQVEELLSVIKKYDDYSEEQIEELRTHLMSMFLEGTVWQKEQMMKKAVEGKIAERVQGKLYARCQVPKTMGVEFGDKVRIIIVKED